MKRQIFTKLFIGLIILGEITLLMSCDNENGTEQRVQDLVLTYQNVKVIIDASLQNNYSTAEINIFCGYIQEMLTLEDSQSSKVRNYINNKDIFIIHVKPLIGYSDTEEYEVVNEKELIVNSNFAADSGQLIAAVYSGVLSGMIPLYSLNYVVLWLPLS